MSDSLRFCDNCAFEGCDHHPWVTSDDKLTFCSEFCRDDYNNQHKVIL